METFVLNAEPREITGRKVSRLRRAGQVPVVLYGHHVSPTLLSVKRGEMEKIYRKAGGSSVVTLKSGSDEKNVLIHQVQLDPVTGTYMHADFYQVRMDEKIKTQVPLVFEGTPPAVRELDGVLVTNLSELEVECLPKDLPHEITVSVDDLATFDDTLTVADITVPSGVAVLADPETNVALVSPPRTQEEVDEAAETPDEIDMDAVEEEGEKGEDAEGEEVAEGGEAKPAEE